MHGFEDVKSEVVPAKFAPWYAGMTRYHWFVLVVAALGWIFDCLDQQLFILARPAAMKDLVETPLKQKKEAAEKANDAKAVKAVEDRLNDGPAMKAAIGKAGNYATSVFLMGWATGGLFFGMLGDRIGRAKTMLITILLYSAFTGLSALSTGVWDFAIYRFLTGLGVGGEFAVGVALVAEVMPAAARPYCLALLQAFSALGNISAALINLGLGIAEEEGLVTSPWRIMFIVGALPALLALVIRAWLKEPEKWQQASHEGAVAKQLGSYVLLFQDPRWRKHALLGLVLACSGVIGLWAVGFFTPDLMRLVQRKGVATKVANEQIDQAQKARDAAIMGRSASREANEKIVKAQNDRIAILVQIRQLENDPKAPIEMTPELTAVRGELEPIISGRLSKWASYTSILINVGAFFGMFGFGIVSQRIGRRPTFAIGLLAAFFSTVAVFWFLQDFAQLWMVPIMGFCQLSLFAGYAMYFPELFPTHLRSTGTSFCYNVGRFVAATGPLIQAQLIGFFTGLYKDTGGEPLRYAGITMCSVFLLGLFVLPFLPETRGKPLPE